MTAEELLRELSNRLNLPYEGQDWGIINADPGRLEEFIDLYETEKLEPSQRFELSELILASANERLVGGANETDRGIQRVLRLVCERWEELGAEVEYWAGLDDSEEFPLAMVLRKLR